MKMLMMGIAVCLGALGASALSPRALDNVVMITDKSFSPDNMEIKVGEKVYWKNSSAYEHTVTATVKPGVHEPQEEEKPLFDSGVLKPGDSFEFTFNKPGTY